MEATTKNHLQVNTPYNKAEILRAVAGFGVSRDNKGNVITRFKNTILKKWRSSDAYEVVNFKNAVTMLLGVIGGIMNPTAYSLTIKGAYQELKLKGRKITINGDVFFEMLWLTNSTDGTRVLSVRYGLFREICSNGACVTVDGSSYHQKHLTTYNVNEGMKEFMNELPKLNVNEQVAQIKALGRKTVSVRKLANALVNETGTKGNDKVWNLLVRKLSSSKTDALGEKEDALIEGINVPFKKMKKATLDKKLPAYKVFNCYTEIWRSLDASQIERETGKILEVING